VTPRNTTRITRDLSLRDYRSLAELRHQIRRFLHFSEEAARQHGIEPQQHQLLLAIKGLPAATQPTIGEIARRLQLRHHSTVELVNRLTEHGAITRRPGVEDKREVLLGLTPIGERLLRNLSVDHHAELQTVGPALRDALDAVLHVPSTKPKNNPRNPKRNMPAHSPKDAGDHSAESRSRTRAAAGKRRIQSDGTSGKQRAV